MNPTLRAEANAEVNLEIIQNGENEDEEDDDDSSGTDSVEFDAEDEHYNNNMATETIELTLTTQNIKLQEVAKKPEFIPKVPKATQDMMKNIVIHIHGGGYIAMSSGHHQLYTRHLANDVELPIFSIDYRLAPGTQFPENIEDCVTAYLWVLDYLEKVIGVIPETITMMGDSAGGGLCFALCLWLIENK